MAFSLKEIVVENPIEFIEIDGQSIESVDSREIEFSSNVWNNLVPCFRQGTDCSSHESELRRDKSRDAFHDSFHCQRPLDRT